MTGGAGLVLLRRLEKTVEEKSTGLIVYLGVDPLFDPLRSEPSFQALLKQMQLVH
jgi:hypothetical protein